MEEQRTTPQTVLDPTSQAESSQLVGSQSERRKTTVADATKEQKDSQPETQVPSESSSKAETIDMSPPPKPSAVYGSTHTPAQLEKAHPTTQPKMGPSKKWTNSQGSEA